MRANRKGSVPPKWGTMKWMLGEMVAKDRAQVSVFDHGFIYGDGVFEGGPDEPIQTVIGAVDETVAARGV